MQRKTDEILMAEVKAGKTNSLGTLYERYKALLYTYFLRSSGDSIASNDLLMNTFERLYKYRKSYKEEAAFRPWCFQIANNLLKDHFKLKKRHTELEVLRTGAEKLADESKEFDAPDYADLYKALEQLSPLDRRIITQYYLLESPYSEISLMEGISVNSARIRVCRALKKLNELMINSDV